ncbi:N-acetylglucosamine kinase [Cryptosporangium sp. NPDC051539]|uniref:N-acetylglucosamine kinase n=1 Tax=Cryptosporangium sp. NPDC051539 TaxID=3363962 RepID=UPI00379AEC52
MKVLVALDAGNSKTDAAVVRTDGTVLATVRGDGFRPTVDGPDAALAGVVATIRAAVAAAGAPPAALLAAYLANADFPAEVERYRDGLSALALADRTVVGNDTFALLRSGARRLAGVAAICGAGINCLGIAEDGTVFRFPALGKLSGDWGGGSGMAAEAMFAAARGEDGRGPATALAAAIAGHFRTRSAVALAEELHFGRVESGRLHEIVPLIFDVASAGDATARAIVARQAEELGLMAGVALRRLALTERSVDVVLGGGVLAAGHPLLLDDVQARIEAMAPLAAIRIPDVSPLAGAILLGLDELGAPAEAEERIRATYREWSARLVRA